MRFSEVNNLSVADLRRAELRRELDEIRAARGLPADDPSRPLIRRVRALRHRIGVAVARLRAAPSGGIRADRAVARSVSNPRFD